MNRIDPNIVKTAPTLEEALSILVKFSRMVGEAYFPALVEGLAKALNVRWAFVCRFDSATLDEATTISFWDNGPADNFVYKLRDTPCADVASQGACCFADDITQLYPLDDMLADIGAKSYAGAALRSLDGRVLGLVAVMDDTPFIAPRMVEKVVDLFSARAGAELERLATASLNERLGKIVEASVSEAYVFASESCRFELVNCGARENLGYTMEELRLLTPWDLKPEYSKKDFLDALKPLRNGKVKVVQFETLHLRKDGSTYPVSVNVQFFPADGGVFFASITDITERRAKEAHEKLLLNEMNHRVKNVLTIVQILARQTAETNPEFYLDRLSARISGLAASHDVLVENSWQDLPFQDIIYSQLGHFRHLIGRRIIIRGPSIKVKAEAAQGFGLALHELATNASKYGALSVSDGCITITWKEIDTDNGQHLHMSWVESGGPLVIAPSRAGFGSLMLKEMLAYQLGCNVKIDYHPSGLQCSFTVPKDRIFSA
ncbi:PAS domain S-box protein [Pleurocapsales cyanobacterium LEGE 06147]|nr:PAS domain S-box protein [Pleurocapsales cyanobacterium LEGE 06147]